MILIIIYLCSVLIQSYYDIMEMMTKPKHRKLIEDNENIQSAVDGLGKNTILFLLFITAIAVNLFVLPLRWMYYIKQIITGQEIE